MQMEDFGKGCLVSAGIGCGGIILMFGLFIFGISSVMNTAISQINTEEVSFNLNYQETHLSGSRDAGKRIAVIDIKGIIATDMHSSSGTAPATIQGIFRDLAQRDDIGAIVLDINSPGGEVTASDDIHHTIMEYKQKTRIPVVAYFGPMAASGGYYVGCAADSIVAHRTSLTGSIGVIINNISYYGLMEKIGIGSQAITSGKMKDALSGARPARPEETALFQEMVNAIFGEFVDVVAKGRGMTPEAIRSASFGDGRVILGKDAVGLGLVDRNGYFDDAVELAGELGRLPKESIVFHIGERPSFFQMLFNMFSDRSVNITLPGGISGRVELEPGKAYYLLPQYAQ